MHHSIWINDKNTFDDFSIIPITRPVVNEPEPITVYVDVHGTDGPLDLSEALTGMTLYKNRTGSWDFHIKNYRLSWDAICHNLSNYFHGKRMKVILEDDRDYYYMGRLELDKFSAPPKISIKYNLEPYKYEICSGNEPWLWDPFSFETGIIRNYGGPEVIVNGDGTITEVPPIVERGYTIMGPLVVDGDNSLKIEYQDIRTERPVPIIIYVFQDSQNDMSVKLGGGSTSYPLEVGKLNNLTAMLAADLSNPRFGYIGREGKTFVFSGHGGVYIKFQGGWL